MDLVSAITLPTDGKCYGFWIGNGPNEDVHIDIECDAFVIGHNTDIPHMKFTPSALCFNKDGTVSYQFKGDDGEAKTKAFSADFARKLILGLLAQVDAVAKSL